MTERRKHMNIDRSEISDLYKDAYGTRPTAGTMAHVNAMSDAEYEGFAASLMEELSASIDREDLAEKEDLEIMNQRLLGMMADYNISLSKAIEWDFESFGSSVNDLYEEGGDGYVQYQFEFYLWQNGIHKFDNIKHYTDIFMGRKDDLILVKK